MGPRTRRVLLILAAVILVSCTASAYLSWHGGRLTKAVGTFAAGLTFAVLIGSNALRER